jgi:hypothetical protein
MSANLTYPPGNGPSVETCLQLIACGKIAKFLDQARFERRPFYDEATRRTLQLPLPLRGKFNQTAHVFHESLNQLWEMAVHPDQADALSRSCRAI